MTIPVTDSAPPRAQPAEYVVAFLDILGFKQALAKPGGLVTALGWHDELRRLARMNALSLHLSPAAVAQVETRHLSVSDGVYMWSDATPGRAAGFIISVSAFVAAAVKARIPLRGAVAAGECVIDPRSLTFVGQPLVDAVEGEKCQEWLGVAVLPSAVKVLAHDGRVVRHDVPTKPRPARSWWRRCLGGTEPGPRYSHALAWHQEILPDEAIAALDALSATAPDSSVRKKYANARRFVESHPLDAP